MWRQSGLALALTAFLVTGCYHQVVHTGATPATGNAVVKKTAAIYFFGLVGAEVNTTADCPSGVAVIETQQTFINGLVGVLTLGIYTPRTVTITCAAGEDPVPDAPVFTIATNASTAEAETAARRAFELARRSNEPVILRYLR